jgi:hypothetical protein
MRKKQSEIGGNPGTRLLYVTNTDNVVDGLNHNLLNHAGEARLRHSASRIFILGAVEVDSVVESGSSVDQLQ